MSFRAKTFQEVLSKHRPMKRSATRSRHGAPRQCQHDVSDGSRCGFTAYSSKSMDAHYRRAHRQIAFRRQSKRLGPGKNTKAWESERRKLKKRFEAIGIITCELQYEGCANDDYLGFAHAAKRRKLTGLCLNNAFCPKKHSDRFKGGC